MKNIIKLVTLLCVSTFLSGCVSYNSAPGKMSELEGTYELTQYTYTPDEGDKIDFIKDRGAKSYLVVNSSGYGYTTYEDNEQSFYVDSVRYEFVYNTDEEGNKTDLIRKINYTRGISDKAWSPREGRLELGFNKIHLQGHSLGCTKIIYVYNKLKEENYKNIDKIKTIILLSLVDIPNLQMFDLGEEKNKEMLELANKMEAEGKEMDLMPYDSFDHPISAKTYLRYYRDNEKIDFAKFWDKNYTYPKINNIEIPLFLRWGENDFIVQKLEDLIEELKLKIKNENLDIGYIKETDHGYTNKEEILGKEIVDFIQR